MNRIDIEKYKSVADRELVERTDWESKGFLSVNKIAKKDGVFVVDRHEVYKNGNGISFYYKLEEAPYFFCVWINKDGFIDGTGPVNYNHCFFTAKSDELSLEELQQLTKLKHTGGWSKGDLRRSGNSIYNCSSIDFELLNHDSYFTEDAVSLILDELEKDEAGVKNLVEKAYAGITIHHRRYVDASDGMNFDAKMIKRLANLGIGIDIDADYVWGERYKDEDDK